MAKVKLPKIEELFNAGVHFGHQVRRWDPNMEPFIFAVRSGIHVIDLDQTHKLLKEAADALEEVAKTGGQIIFVGTKKQAKDIVALEAARCGALYVNERWLGGTITNYPVIKKNIDKLLGYLKRREEGDFEKYTKKERLLLDREIDKLQRDVGGITSLQGSPAAVFVVDGKRERTAIKEAKKSGIPVFGLIDTNTNPNTIDYAIPGNDDAIRSIALIMKVIADAVEEGYKTYAKKGDKTATVEEDVKSDEIKEDVKEVKPTVTGSTAPHASEEAGEKHAERVEKGAEPVETKVEEDKKEEKEEVKEKKPAKRGRPKKTKETDKKAKSKK